MGNTARYLLTLAMNIVMFPAVLLKEMVKGIFDHENTLTHPANTSPMDVVRSESYRTLKRRNRLLRKSDHKKDE